MWMCFYVTERLLNFRALEFYALVVIFSEITTYRHYRNLLRVGKAHLHEENNLEIFFTE